MKRYTQYSLILFVSLFFTLFYNYTFFKNILEVYPFDSENSLFVSSIFIVLTSFSVLLATLFSSRYTTKPILILVVFISAFTAYFMDSYNVVIDDSMIRNSMQTNLNESLDLFSLKLVLYVVFLGILPSYFIYKSKIEYFPFKKELFFKLRTIILSVIVIVIMVMSLSKFYTSFVREHKPLRYYANPVYWIYSIGKYVNKTLNNGPLVVKAIGTDATIIKTIGMNEKTKLVIMVVGEAARADHFSLNGYTRQTNPILEKEDIVNFPNMFSCGTSTAESVPCMFSIFDRSSYDYKKGISTETVVDVLNHTQAIKVLWRDNNSSSKGVALRVDYEDYRTNKTNTMCENNECRDEGMLIGLDAYIKANEGKSILIVLHQMGNHGPAYYKRYPKEFEKFTPVCTTNQLENCTQEEIGNAYDNAILYTDYFLSKVINFLKPYSKEYETAMIYMSDHGESLGENGVYLHGLPYFMAPDAQKHIGSVMWFDGLIKERLDVKKLKSYNENSFSQDNLFHTLLGLFEVQTNVYKQDMDMLHNAKK